MADAVADKESHQIDINGSESELPPAVKVADPSREQKKQRLLAFAKELSERKEKQVADLRSEADQTTNALLQISGIYFGFVGLLLSIVAGGSNISCRHLWSPIALCTLGSIGFWIAFSYLVFVSYEKEHSRQKLVKEIDDIETSRKNKIDLNSFSTITHEDLRREAIRLGLISKHTDSDAEEEASKSIYKILSDKYNRLDAKAKGLFFFVFLGGLALIATYFTVIFSIIHILCSS
jgi:hypothetical protein